MIVMLKENNFKKSILIFVMIVGIVFICYPFVAKILSNLSNSIDVYKEEVDNMDEKSKDDLINKYNKNAINIEDAIGYLEIDKINLSLLIYEGSSDKVLSQGVGHLENTGLPINKKSYNCVLVRSYRTYL